MASDFDFVTQPSLQALSMREGKTERQKMRACLLGPFGTAMGANSRDRGGNDRVHARVVEKIAFQGGRTKA